MGFIVIPGTKTPEHIKENHNIYDFNLTDEEMEQIAKINKNVRYYNRTDAQLEQFATWGPDFENHIYLKICEAIIDQDISTLKTLIPEKSINHIIGESKSKKQWLEDIENETIKYYGIEILKIKVSKEKENDKWITKDWRNRKIVS